jgi:SSS family solute:Na+ symporter
VTPLDAGLILGFVAYVLAAGWRSRRAASADLEQYFLAGRKLNGWQAGLSMAATQFAADTPMLATGLVAVGGIFALWRLWIYALAFLLLGFLLAACWRRAGVLTDAELAELRYRGRSASLLRLFKAVYFGIVFNCFALAIVLLAAARLAEPFLHWHAWLPGPLFDAVRALAEGLGIALGSGDMADPAYWTRSANNLISILLIAALTLAYSTLGGLRAVVRTDVVQFAVMMIASAAYAVTVVELSGGLDGLAGRLQAAFPDGVGPQSIAVPQLLAFTPAASDVGGLLLAVILMQWLIQVNADGSGYLAQRAMACRDDREARRAAVVFAFAQVLLRSLVWLPIALGLLLLFPPDPAVAPGSYVADREGTFVRGIAELLPPGLLGLLLTGMLAALASTMDTHLNWGASYLTHDLYRRFATRLRGAAPDERSLVRAARISNLLLLAVSFGVMLQLGSIRAAWEASLLLGAGVGIVLVLRWFWWRVTAWGELAAIATAAIAVPLALAAIPEHAAPLRLLAVAAACTAVTIAVSLWVRPASAADLLEFYRRVRPPGVWGPVARLAGDDPRQPLRELGRGTAATLACAATLFGALIGVGTWLVGATPPAWLPERSAWIALNLSLAVAALPFWLRLGFPRAV